MVFHYLTTQTAPVVGDIIHGQKNVTNISQVVCLGIELQALVNTMEES